MIRWYFSLFLFILIHFSGFAQTNYTISKDPKDSTVFIFKGFLSSSVLKNEPSFKWFREGWDGYTPSPNKISLLQQADSTLHFIVFGGTWCDDTQFILPRFLKWLSLSSFPEERISIFGVDRNKKTTGNLSSALNVSRVPTIIVMKNGKEVDRVVEYGKTGLWDKELADFIR